jgi:3-oxo-5-alpha-steroid 4-dehydrogenase 1
MNDRLFFQWLLLALFAVAAIVFVALLFMPAPYGRHLRKGWGPKLHPTLGWVIMESPAILVIALCYILGRPPGNIIPVVFVTMWELHYIQRTFLFPVLLRGTKRPWPILLIFFALVFNTINGYLNGRWLFYFSPVYPDAWLMDPRFIIGLELFLGGFIINLHSDHVLRNLRAPGETGYKIPCGGFFEYVSSANYFGELVEWTGWALATWSLAGLAFAIFTAANLVPRALAHHRWYRAQFPDYPEQRKAIIPYIL